VTVSRSAVVADGYHRRQRNGHHCEAGAMLFEDLESLRRHNAAWRLLRADNAPFILGFLGTVFIEDNIRSISAAELADRLDDELDALNHRLGDGTFPQRAKAYLDDWAAPETGWLRKYYPPGSDEAHYDATPAVEKALAWTNGLRERSFVGTESRLNTLFDLLRQMVFGAETDPAARLTELRRRRLEIDREIAAVEAGRLPIMAPSALRDRYQQFAITARELLADFREVEANFRALDRDLRARITAWEGAKGDLLDDVLGDRNSIAESDQGKSFQAFYDFLLSPRRQTEFTDLAAIEDPDPRVRRIHYDWLDAGERTQATVRLLSEQLRRFLDDQAWLENRRVMEILHSIEGNAVRLRELAEPDLTCEMDSTTPTVALPMERPLYTPPDKIPLTSDGIGDADDDLDSSLLFEQVFVDPARLSANVRSALRAEHQIGLAELLRRSPLDQGLAELVTYLSLRDPEFEVVFDEGVREPIEWQDVAGRTRTAHAPRVTFARAGGRPEHP
jgi:hypothetical protein